MGFGVEGTVPQGSSSGGEVDPNLVRAIGFQLMCTGGNAHRWTPMTLATRCRMSELVLLSQIASLTPRTALEKAVETVTGFPITITLDGRWVYAKANRDALDNW